MPWHGPLDSDTARGGENGLDAGVGVSWYTWLEQRRDIHPSPQVLDAIARVLRLDTAERAHLFHLARVELPLSARDYPREASPALRAMVDALAPHPAYVTGPRMDVLAWNRPAALVMHDFGADPPNRRNILYWLFGDPASRERPTWEGTARNALARLRAEQARRPGDPAFTALVDELTEASPEFREWWPLHDVRDEQWGTKTIPHQTLGELRLHHLQTTPTSDPDLRLTIYTPADEATKAKLAALTPNA